MALKRLVAIPLMIILTFTIVWALDSEYYQRKADREFEYGKRAQKQAMEYNNKATRYNNKATRHFEEAERYQKKANRRRKEEQEERRRRRY